MHVERSPKADHSRDEDCCVDPETGACFVCHVGHGYPCPDCGKCAFHADDCPEMGPSGLDEFFQGLGMAVWS